MTTDTTVDGSEAAGGPQTAVGPNEAPTAPIAQETGTEAPLRTFSPEARTVEQATRTALAAVTAELVALRAERDGPMAERIRQLVADQERLRRCVAVFNRSAVTT